MRNEELIICDTNIWYGIANKTIPEENYKGKNLALTGLNIDEIISSENVYKNPELIKNVVKAIRLNMTDLIFEGPFEYIYNITPFKNKIDLNYRLDRYKYMMSLETTEFNPNVTFENFKSQIENFDSEKIKMSQIMNNGLGSIQANKELYGKSAIRNLDLKKVARRLIREKIRTMFFNGEAILDIMFPYEDIELYTIAWEAHTKELSLQLNSKVTANDIYDLFHLLYVSRSAKYWTKEKKWNRLIANSKEGRTYLIEKNDGS